MKRSKLIFGGGIVTIVIAFLLLQIVPLTQDYTNPPVIQEPSWDSPETRTLAERACFDCHSNETEWPWYSKIAPMSMTVRHDVEKGREVLNFSEWKVGSYDQAATEEMVEVISKDQMPLPYYMILHPEARLNEAERGQLINGLIASLERDNRLETEELNDEEQTD